MYILYIHCKMICICYAYLIIYILNIGDIIIFCFIDYIDTAYSTYRPEYDN